MRVSTGAVRCCAFSVPRFWSLHFSHLIDWCCFRCASGTWVRCRCCLFSHLIDWCCFRCASVHCVWASAQHNARDADGMMGSHKAIWRYWSGLCDVRSNRGPILFLHGKTIRVSAAGILRGFPNRPRDYAGAQEPISVWYFDQSHPSGAAVEKKSWFSCCCAAPP